MAEHVTMTGLPESERPYEKFRQNGVKSLSDAELLAIIIKNGTRERTATELARDLLTGRQGNLLNLHELTYEELMAFPGIGRVKAMQIKAVAELASRIVMTRRMNEMHMDNPQSVADYYMEHLRHFQTEVLMAAYFNAKCAFLGDAVVSQGSVSSSFVSPREIFRRAVLKNAVHFILLHNHPSGDPSPSGDDIRVTETVCRLGEMMGIRLTDHIIIGDNEYYSFRDNYLI